MGQPGEASSALCHSPVAELPASCCPSTSCIYHLGRDATSPSRSCALPACNAHQGLFSWYHCPLRALPWVQVRGICLQAEHGWSTCIKNQHSPYPPSCPGPPAWNSQAEGSTSLHETTIQPWHVAPRSRVNLTMVGTVPGCSSQGHHQWPKLLSTVTSG